MATTDPNSLDTSFMGAGASLGSSFGPEGTIIGAGAGLALGGIKYLLGSAQRKQANSIHPYDPGYVMNPEVMDNARITGSNYSNYHLPGYQEAVDNIKGNAAASMTRAERGATSSADVIDAANKGAYATGQQLEQLAATSAQGKESALTKYLAAKAAAGEEMVNKNTYDREMYNQQLQLKNQLNNNATANQYSAADQAGKLISSIFSYKGGVRQPGPQGAIQQGAGIFGSGDQGDPENFSVSGASDPNDPNS